MNTHRKVIALMRRARGSESIEVTDDHLLLVLLLGTQTSGVRFSEFVERVRNRTIGPSATRSWNGTWRGGARR